MFYIKAPKHIEKYFACNIGCKNIETPSLSISDIALIDGYLSDISFSICRGWPRKSTSSPDVDVYIRNLIRNNYYIAAIGEVIFIFDELLSQDKNKSNIEFLPKSGFAWTAQIAKEVFKKDVFIFDTNTKKWYDYFYQEEISCDEIIEDVLYNKYKDFVFLASGSVKLNANVREEIKNLFSLER